MNLEIKAASVYKAEIPVDVSELNACLKTRAFQPPGQLQMTSTGFVPPVDDGSEAMVREFSNGLVMALRIDERVVPPQVVREETTKAVKAAEATAGRKVGKNEKKEIREKVLVDLMAVAMIRTTAIVPIYYHNATGILLVATASKPVADICTGNLVLAVGGVKTETINVSGVRHGATTRFKNWLVSHDDEIEPTDGEAGFGDFDPVDTVQLVAKSGDEPTRKISVHMGDLATARDGMVSAIQRGFEVKALGLTRNGLTFVFTDDFRFRSIDFPMPDGGDDDCDASWQGEACLQVAYLVDAVEVMAQMFAYKPPEGETEAQEGGCAG